MKIHFVCTGNTFRSRLAEAYMNSKETDIIATSSGIEASRNLSGPICWYTENILKENGILKYASTGWHETNKKILESQDLVIFMAQDQFDFSVNNLGAKITRYEIWNVPDVNEVNLKNKITEGLIEDSKETFGAIKNNVDKLLISINDKKDIT